MWNGQIYRNRVRNPLTGNPMWWRKNAAPQTAEKSEHMQSEKLGYFETELVEFVRNVTLHCLRWLVEPHIDGLQR